MWRRLSAYRDALTSAAIAAGTSLLLILVAIVPIVRTAYVNESSWSKEVHGIRIYYSFAPPREFYDGISVHSALPCRATIYINPVEIDSFYRSAQHYLTAILAHESGHCLANKRLHDPNGGYKTAEQFAWAYARAHYQTCRLDASAYLPGPTHCIPPRPEEVTPERYPVPPLADPGAPPEFSPNPIAPWPPLPRP